MISCSPWNDGFELVYGDRCLFRHSSKSPGLFFSRAAVSTSNSKLKFPLLWKGFGPCAISPKAAECLLSFPGGVTARLEFSGRSVGMRFSSLPGDGKALGLRFPSARGERFFGLGPSAELRLRGGTSYYLLPDSENRRKKFPTVFSSRNWWVRCEDIAAGAAWNLGRDRADLRFAGIPREIIIGSGENPGAAMESLAARVKPGNGTVAKNSLDVAGIATSAPILRLSGRGPRYEELRPLFEDAGMEFGLIVDERAGEGREIEAGRVSGDFWNSQLRDSGYRAIEETAGIERYSKTITALTLSLSFSGGLNPFIPVRWGFGAPEAEGSFLPCLDLAPFGPLFELAPGSAQGIGRGLQERLAVASILFGMMKPYRERCAREWRERGIPAFRHPAFLLSEASESGRELWDIDEEYLFGQDLLVAPGKYRGSSSARSSRTLVLPPGRWVHLWTSRSYPPGVTTVEDPPGRPAIFYRKESEFSALFDEIRKKAARLG